MLLEPAVADNVPLHVLLAPFGVATTSPETSVSEKATPVSAKLEFGLAMLNVTVEVPPTAMLVGKKALLMVGGLATVSVAVLLVVPVPPLVEVMVPVVLAFDPPVVPFTSTAMVHEPLADAGESQVVMSDFHYERATCVEVVERAHGDVLVAGLGLGMILRPILGKESVRSVTVIEKYQDVVDLVLPTLPASEKLTVLLDDIYTWKPPQGRHYDVIWFDIWPDIEVNRLP